MQDTSNWSVSDLIVNINVELQSRKAARCTSQRHIMAMHIRIRFSFFFHIFIFGYMCKSNVKVSLSYRILSYRCRLT